MQRSLLPRLAVALGLTAGAIRAESPALGVLAAGTYLVVPPLVHATHHDGWLASGKSIATRVGVPIGAVLLAGAAGTMACPARDGAGSLGCSVGFIGAGMVAGFGAAMMLDAVVIARAPARARRSSLAFTPNFRASGDSGWFGLSGRF